MGSAAGVKLLPGRPYGLPNEARRILKTIEYDMSQIGGGRMAGEIVGGIKAAVAKAMDEAKGEIVGATTELVAEIRDGAKNVKRAIQTEVMNVRKEFSDIVGNATAEAEEAVEEARTLAERAINPNGGGAA